jgi:hypothetical protein
MHTRSSEFRAQAEECRKLATCLYGAGKSQYEELARRWQKLAERLDRHGATAIAA